MGELMNLPNRIFHTLYHNHYLVEEARAKREAEEAKKGKSSSNGRKFRNPLDDMTATQMEDLEDELEDAAEEGML
jgi:hypothetical protein